MAWDWLIRFKCTILGQANTTAISPLGLELSSEGTYTSGLRQGLLKPICFIPRIQLTSPPVYP